MDKLIQQRSFDELSEAERKEVLSIFGDRESFEAFQQQVFSIKAERTMRTDRSTRRALIQQMKQKHQPVWQVLLTKKVPAYLLVPMIFLTFLPFFLSDRAEQPIEKIVLVSSLPKVDTVVMVKKADTVFIDRVREVPVYITVEKKPEMEKELPVRRLAGKSMAEQEPIRSLIVGSELQ